MMRRFLLRAALVAGILLSLGAVAGYTTKVYLTDGGDTQVIASGGKVSVESGGEVDFESGASLKLAGTARLGWGALYMTGIPVDQELFTVGGRKYEIDEDDSGGKEGGGDVNVPMASTMTADQAVTQIAAAITGDGTATWNATADTTNDILFVYADTAGVAGNSITLVEGFTNADVSAATLVDGADAAMVVVQAFRHTITTTEATGGATAAIRIDTGLTSIEAVFLSLEDAAVEAITGVTVTVSGGILTLVEGTPAWADADVLNILIVGTE